MKDAFDTALLKYSYRHDSPLGGITLASDGTALTGLWFDGQKHFPAVFLEGNREKPLPVFLKTLKWLDAYFGGEDPGFTPAIHIRATPFRRTVWEILQEIPYGQTLTYGEIAARIAVQTGRSRMSAQAVGGAVGNNPVSLIIPCHRVVGADGSLTGYAAGLHRKAELLRLEGAIVKDDRIVFPEQTENQACQGSIQYGNQGKLYNIM